MTDQPPRCPIWNTNNRDAPNYRCVLHAGHSGHHHHGCGTPIARGRWCILPSDHRGRHWYLSPLGTA